MVETRRRREEVPGRGGEDRGAVLIEGQRPIALGPFLAFCRGQVALGDTDPHVAVYARVSHRLKLGREARAWLALLTMAYYHDGSGWRAWRHPGVLERRALPPADSPISKQRRNLFGGRIQRHLEDLYGIGDLGAWLRVPSWSALVERLRGLYGNGRWASYTTAELLVRIGAVDVTPDTYEIAGSSGPRRGLGYLRLPATEAAAAGLHALTRAQGIEVNTEVFESVLCNWNRMNGVGFYLGHNLDRQQVRLRAVEALGTDATPLWEARRAVFDHRALGELQGREGVDKARMRLYREVGRIPLAWEER
jgi:hypothetical protein